MPQQVNGNRAVIEELKKIVASDGEIDEQTFRRLTLAAIMNIYFRLDEVAAIVVDHSHPEFKEMIKKSDTWGMMTAILAGLPGLFALWKIFNP